MMQTLSMKVKVVCDTPGCRLPCGYLKDGMLIIESQHHGDRHVTVVNLQTIQVEALDKRGKIPLE